MSNQPAIGDEQRQHLVRAARDAQHAAYVPYSHYPVGAAILTSAGDVFTGCNVENASYGATICAERTAAVKAISEGARHFDAIAIVTSNAASPCGICRQFLYEFGPAMTVILADEAGAISWEGPLSELLVLGFGPQKLARGQEESQP